MNVLRNAISKNKKVLFPKIVDWSSDNDHMRNREDWWKMPVFQFIFFHRLGYKYFLVFTNGFAFIFFGLASWYFFGRSIEIFGILMGLFALRMLVAAIKKIKTWRVNSIITFYDIILREY